jgi:hypothetical protein
MPDLRKRSFCYEGKAQIVQDNALKFVKWNWLTDGNYFMYKRADLVGWSQAIYMPTCEQFPSPKIQPDDRNMLNITSPRIWNLYFKADCHHQFWCPAETRPTVHWHNAAETPRPWKLLPLWGTRDSHSFICLKRVINSRVSTVPEVGLLLNNVVERIWKEAVVV